MLEAYFDESGIHGNTGVCVIAGYWGHSAQWKIHEQKWRGVLRRFNFPLEEFHSTSLIEKPKHRPMLEALARSIATSEIYPISSGIIVDDFFLFSPKQRQFLTGATLDALTGKLKTSGKQKNPYFVPFQSAIATVTDYTRSGRKANFFFGLDRPMANYANVFFAEIKTRGGWEATWASRSRLGDPAFPLAKETPELQAADLYANLTYRRMRECHKTGDWSMDPCDLLKLCLRKTRNWDGDHEFFNKDILWKRLEETYAISGNWNGH